MAPNSPACSFIHASMAGSRSIAPLNRSNSVLIVARLYIRVRRINQPAQLCGVRGRSMPQLHMAHELAGALQQAGRIRQRRAVKKTHVYMRSEYIDVAEGRISQTCNRTAVMQKLPDFVSAFSGSPQTTEPRWLPIHLHALSSTHRWRDLARQRR